MMPHEVLVVDDEADIRSLLAGVLEDEGYGTRQAAHADEALDALKARSPHLVILDIWLTGSRMDGLQLLDEIKRNHADLPVLMISGHGTIETAVSAIKRGAYDFIEKPFKTDRLLLQVKRAIEAAALRQENEDLRKRSESDFELIGTSSVMAQLRQSVAKVAITGSRVLISGPAGSGKEVVARAIHQQSKRKDNSFSVINCAALHPDRLEQELFGMEPDRQANVGRKIGVMEKSHGGTLLLDEVADMPMETQGKIVRVLQEQSFERVGGTTRIQVDVRVLATTSQDLAARIEQGKFRQDLFYRLNVVPFQVPSLAHRREDIPSLAQHFMQKAAKASGTQPRAFGEDALAALQSYAWPGNVRQLRNVVEWLLIMSGVGDGETVHADMLPPEVGAQTPNVLQWEHGGEIMRLPLREARELFEREYLAAQVTRFGGNISKTSAFVGMERSALHRKLKSLGVHGGERAAEG